MKKPEKPSLDKLKDVAKKAHKEDGFIAEFKKFIAQGSVIDLAVGVVIGTAFSAIVTSLVNDIIMPIVSLVGGGADFTNLSITIPNFFGGDTAAVIRYGNFIQNVVNFLIIAFSLFIVIKAWYDYLTQRNWDPFLIKISKEIQRHLIATANIVPILSIIGVFDIQ